MSNRIDQEGGTIKLKVNLSKSLREQKLNIYPQEAV